MISLSSISRSSFQTCVCGHVQSAMKVKLVQNVGIAQRGSFAHGPTSRSPLPRSQFVGSLSHLQQRCAPRCRINSTVVRTRKSEPEILDRALGALPYLIPLFDGLRYGRCSEWRSWPISSISKKSPEFFLSCNISKLTRWESWCREVHLQRSPHLQRYSAATLPAHQSIFQVCICLPATYQPCFHLSGYQ